MSEVILLTMVIAKFKGYKLKPLFKQWPIYIILGFELMYVFLQVSTLRGNISFIKYITIFKTLYFCSFLILVIKYKQYKSAIIGSFFIFVGSILNNIVISVNYGKMPVFPTVSYLTGFVTKDTIAKVSNIHVLGNQSTRLWFLTDFIDLGYSILSIGDVFIKFFAFIIIFDTIKYLNKIEVINSNH